jgi:hypothetical protein
VDSWLAVTLSQKKCRAVHEVPLCPGSIMTRRGHVTSVPGPQEVASGARKAVQLSAAWLLTFKLIDMGPNDSVPDSMTHQTKKKRVEDQPFPTDAGQRPIQLQRRRVWRACEGCRSASLYFFHFDHTHAHNRLWSSRKKIKCDGNEPTCSQCAASGSQCTWLQTKDRAALSRQYVTFLWP